MKILIVDSRPDTDAIIKLLPECKVTFANSFCEAVTKIVSEPFDMLLASMCLPQELRHDDNAEVANGFLLAFLAVGRGIKSVALISTQDSNWDELTSNLEYLLEQYPEESGCFKCNGAKVYLRNFKPKQFGEEWLAAFKLFTPK